MTSEDQEFLALIARLTAEEKQALRELLRRLIAEQASGAAS